MALMMPELVYVVTPSGSTMPNCDPVAFCTAGAASERMNVVAEPLTAAGPAVAVGFAEVVDGGATHVPSARRKFVVPPPDAGAAPAVVELNSGRSAPTSARNDGVAALPDDGPANTVLEFCAPCDPIPSGPTVAPLTWI